MTTWNAIRRDSKSPTITWEDYQRMLLVEAGRVYRSETGVDMCQPATRAGSNKRIGLTRIRDLHHFVDPVRVGHYSLNDTGRVALTAERARRLATTSPTEGPRP